LLVYGRIQIRIRINTNNYGSGFWRPNKLTDLDLDLAPDPEHCGNRTTKKRSEEKAKGLFLKVQKFEKIEQNVKKNKKKVGQILVYCRCVRFTRIERN
jgi:hypothetical protein